MSYQRTNYFIGSSNLQDFRNLINDTGKRGYVYYDNNNYETIAELKEDWSSNTSSIYTMSNVGIGTSISSQKLNVNGNTNLIGRMTLNNGSVSGVNRGISLFDDTNSFGIYVANNGGTYSFAGNSAANGGNWGGTSLRLRISNSANGGLIIENSGEATLLSLRGSTGVIYTAGNLGVKKIGAVYALDVGGDANITGNYKINGIDINNVSLTQIGNITTSSNNNSSNYILNTSNQIITALAGKAPLIHTHTISDIQNLEATLTEYDMLISGHTHSYNSLTDKPTIPSITEINNIIVSSNLDTSNVISNRITNLNVGDIELLPQILTDIQNQFLDTTENINTSNYIFNTSNQLALYVNNTSNQIVKNIQKDRIWTNNISYIEYNNTKIYADKITIDRVEIVNTSILQKFPKYLYTIADNDKIKQSSYMDYINIPPYLLFNGVYFEGGAHWANNYNYINGVINPTLVYFPNYAGEYVMINLGETMALKSIKIESRPGFSDVVASIFRIYATNDINKFNNLDYTEWDLLHDQTTKQEPVNSTTFEYTITNSSVYQIYALVVKELYGNGSLLNFVEWELYGNQDADVKNILETNKVVIDTELISSNINTSNYILNTSNEISERINNLALGDNIWSNIDDITIYYKNNVMIGDDFDDIYNENYTDMECFFVFSDNGTVYERKNNDEYNYFGTFFHQDYYFWKYENLLILGQNVPNDAFNGIDLMNYKFQYYSLTNFITSCFFNISNLLIPTEDIVFITCVNRSTDNSLKYEITLSYSTNPNKINLRLANYQGGYNYIETSIDFVYNRTYYVSILQNTTLNKIILYINGIQKTELNIPSGLSKIIERLDFGGRQQYTSEYNIYIANPSLFNVSMTDEEVYNLYLTNSYFINNTLKIKGKAKIHTVDYQYLKNNGSNVNFNDTKHFQGVAIDNKITYQSTSSGTKRDLYIDNVNVNGILNLTNNTNKVGYVYYADTLTTTLGDIRTSIPISDITNLDTTIQDTSNYILNTSNHISNRINNLSVAPHTHTIGDVEYLGSELGSIYGTLEGKANVYHLHSYNDLTDKPIITSLQEIGNITNASNLNTSNYVLNTSNEISNRINNLNVGVSLATIGDITTSSNLNTSNYILNTSNNLIANINTKQATITGGATTIATTNLTANRVLLSDVSGKVAVSTITNTTLGYLDATSSIQTQLNSKQATITGSASSIATINLTADKALATLASGKVGTVLTTRTELDYLSGAYSNIQTQLNSKQATLTAGTNISIVGTTISSTSSQWTSGTGLIYYTGGNVGIGTITPSVKLDIFGNVRVKNTDTWQSVLTIENDSGNSAGLSIGGSLNNVVGANNFGIYLNGAYRLIANYATGKINIPYGLDVGGIANIHAGTPFVVPNGKVKSGSLVIGDITQNYGFEGDWGTTTNAGGLVMECNNNTEIVVHDSGTKLQSLISYNGTGDTNGLIEIGKSALGFNQIGSIKMYGNVGIGTIPSLSKLHVVGSTLFEGNLSTTGILQAQGGIRSLIISFTLVQNVVQTFHMGDYSFTEDGMYSYAIITDSLSLGLWSYGNFLLISNQVVHFHQIYNSSISAYQDGYAISISTNYPGSTACKMSITNVSRV